MKAINAGGLLALCVGLAGCGGSPPPAASDPSEVPLMQSEWQALPPDKKYEIETLERLKLGDPKLQDQRAWDKFTKTVILPAKKKDALTPNGDSTR